MSSEPRPNPITNTFNVKDWIPSTSSGNSDFATNATNAVNTNITSTNQSGTFRLLSQTPQATFRN